MKSNALYSAIKKSVSGRLMVYFVQFSALALYARLFSPEQFGIIASIQVFVLFFQMLSDVGIGPAIINEGDVSNDKRNGIFTVTAIFGVFISFCFYLFSYGLNYFYGGYEYQEIAMIVCVSIFFNALNILPITAMNKDAKFVIIAVNDVVIELVAFCVVYFLYLLDVGILALASRVAVQGVLRFTFTWIVSKNTTLGRPTFGRGIYHIKSISSFSLYQFGFNFINYFSRNLDNILIAKFFGMGAVGIYEKSYQLMRYPLMLTTFAMTPAIQPILTKVREDKEKIVEEHNKLTSRLFALSIPISFFLYFNSDDIVLLLFGEQWSDVSELIKVFCVIIPIQSVLSTSGSFFQVMNKPKLMFITGVLAAVANVSLIIVGLTLGSVFHVAVCLIFSFIFNFFQIYFVLFRMCFDSNVRHFYLLLCKVMLVMIPPLFIYTLINFAFLNELKFSVLTSIVLQGILGIISLMLFYRPIKRVVIN
ncbi:TPA: oligosaccharide flippase family protein [Vibrio parahaemolyticus]|nr:oligosaccharide flippase family protein [Vibrio parahaemolyticus]